MSTVAQLVDPADTYVSPVDALTDSLISAAVAFERQAHVLADQNRVLRHDLQRERQRLFDVQASTQRSLDRARRGIVRIRRAHRTQSHAAVTREIKQVVAEITPVPPEKGRFRMTDDPEAEQQLPLPFETCPRCRHIATPADFDVETFTFKCAKCGATWRRAVDDESRS